MTFPGFYWETVKYFGSPLPIAHSFPLLQWSVMKECRSQKPGARSQRTSRQGVVLCPADALCLGALVVNADQDQTGFKPDSNRNQAKIKPIKPFLTLFNPKIVAVIMAFGQMSLPSPAVGRGRKCSPRRQHVADGAAIVTGCYHPVAGNVTTLIVANQRCNRCYRFSNFSYSLLT
jgi:hypothetical protein